MRKTRIQRLQRRRDERNLRHQPKKDRNFAKHNSRHHHVTFRDHRMSATKLQHNSGNEIGRITIDGIVRNECDLITQEYLTRINHAIPIHFTEEANAEAQKLQHCQPELPECNGGDYKDFKTGSTRFNLEELPFVTIDDEDAKDFDDAIFVEEKGGNYILWVAIADVSFYVKPGSAIDTDAIARGNSYYFPGSVTPMLPEVLCNGICSLNPNAPRAVMVVRMEFRLDGSKISSNFAPCIIKSHARLTYKEVQAYYESSHSFDDEINAMLDSAKVLAKILIDKRDEDGALDLDLPESMFTIRKGRVLGVSYRERLFSHRLIEAFMIVANESVATFLTNKEIPFPLRTHPAPDEDKLKSLFAMLKTSVLGARMPQITCDISDPKALSTILYVASEVGKAETVSRLILRSMMQARYYPGPEDSENAIHYGLASERYCHFTSPIRRYADLMVHRALKIALKSPDAVPIPTGQKLLHRCERCNETERNAQDAEREITKRLVCILLQSKIRECFEATVTGILDFGFFVEPNGYPADGLVRLNTMPNDWFIADAGKQQLIGVHTGKRITIGDKIKVKLISVSISRMELDFELAESQNRTKYASPFHKVRRRHK